MARVDDLPTAATTLYLESNVHWLVSKIKFTLIVPRFATTDDVKKKKKSAKALGFYRLVFALVDLQL